VFVLFVCDVIAVPVFFDCSLIDKGVFADNKEKGKGKMSVTS
jgi:hypothetical protein